MKFSGKMYRMIILKVTKKQGSTLSLEDTFFEKPQEVGGQIEPPSSRFRVKNLLLFTDNLSTKLQHRFFSMNFVKFLRTSFLQNTSSRLPLYLLS